MEELPESFIIPVRWQVLTTAPENEVNIAFCKPTAIETNTNAALDSSSGYFHLFRRATDVTRARDSRISIRPYLYCMERKTTKRNDKK